MPPYGGFHVNGVFVGPDDGHEFFQILGMFLGNDVHGVVMGDDAHQGLAGVDHRQGDQVVFLDFPGHVLLVVRHPGADHVDVHDIADPRVPGRHDQVL